MKNVAVYIDLAFCLVVLPLMALIFPIERWFHNFPWYVVSVGMWLYSLYFINRVVTVPSFFRNGRSVMGVMLVVASVVVTYLFTRVTLYTPAPSIFDIGITRVFPMMYQYHQMVWSLFGIVEAFSFAVGLLTETNQQRASRRAVEAERDRAEIALYKAQIKPHFMFNTLNSLYGLFLTHDAKALPSLEKYISMMRYVHNTTMRDMVAVHEEADYIREYVELQSLRLNGKTEVALHIDIEDEEIQVAPMLLVTFVENCFKHGVSPVEPCRIEINIEEKDKILSFSTRNRIFPVNRSGEHLGIDNCRKRLQLLYGDAHTLDTGARNDYYEVKLKIDLGK